MRRNILNNQCQSADVLIYFFFSRFFKHQTHSWFCLISFETYCLIFRIFRCSKLIFLKDLLWLVLGAILSCNYWNNPPVFMLYLYFRVVPKGYWNYQTEVSDTQIEWAIKLQRLLYYQYISDAKCLPFILLSCCMTQHSIPHHILC